MTKCIVCGSHQGSYTIYRSTERWWLCRTCLIHQNTTDISSWVESFDKTYEWGFNSDNFTLEDHIASCNEAVKEINLPIVQQYIRGVNSVLDIGCGTGCFVEAAKSLGMQSEGLELDKSNSLFAASRGLKVHNVCKIGRASCRERV